MALNRDALMTLISYFELEELDGLLELEIPILFKITNN